MMRILKWVGIIIGALVGLILLAGITLYLVGNSKLNETYAIQAEAIAIPNDEASLARGEHLVDASCKSCHGPYLTGQPVLDDPAIGTIYAANLTGLAATHSDADLVRAIRHGVDTDGRGLFIMPAESFIHFSESDLAAIIAYLKTIPPSSEAKPDPSFTFMAHILLGAGVFGDVIPAAYIDHSQSLTAMPEIGANLAYGEYLSKFCESCHGSELSGGQPPDPQSPLAPNLTPGGGLGSSTQEEFISAIRTGVAPSGRQLDPVFMPWPSFGKFQDDELEAIWMYLQSLPAKEMDLE